MGERETRVYAVFTFVFAFCILLASSVPLAAFTLPDTGVVKCYSDLAEITCPQEGWPFYSQDAQYQGSQPDYTDNGDGTVTDVVTGLKWDQEDDGTFRTWQDAWDYCFNQNSRLPTLVELETIVDYTRNGPAINFVFSAQTSADYWSNTFIPSTFPGLPDSAWYINFWDGRSGTYDKTELRYVRCVAHGDAQCELNVDNWGWGIFTVTSDPSGIDCGGDCSEYYDSGTEVTLTATKTGGKPWLPDYVCAWGNCDSVSEDSRSCTVQMDKKVKIIADCDADPASFQNNINILLLLYEIQ